MNDPICGCPIPLAALRRDLELYELDLVRARKELERKPRKSEARIAASVRLQAARLVASVCERRMAEIRAQLAGTDGGSDAG